MKKKSLLVTLASSALLFVAVGASIGGGNLSKVSATCSHDGNHYSAVAATADAAGSKEFWTCCKCHEVYTANPGSGTWADAGQPSAEVRATIDSSDQRYVPATALTFSGGYATGDLIQVNTGLPSGCDYVFADNFLMSDANFVSASTYGNGAIGYVERYAGNASVICFHFNSSAEGQYVVIEAGSTFITSGVTLTLKNTVMFVREASNWSLREVASNEVTIKTISYSTSTLVQVVTNLTVDTKGADTSSGSNGYINLVHPNDTVLWGYYGSGIHPSYNTTYIGFNFNSEVETGKVMVLGKGTTLVLADDSVVTFGVTYNFTKTDAGWNLTVAR